MSFDAIKQKLYDDHSLLVSVIESYGIHHIKKGRKYIHGALPDGGDNRYSFSINLKNDYLATKIYTRTAYNGKDIFDALAFVSGKSIGEVCSDIANKIGVRISREYDKPKESDLLSFLSTITRYDKLSGNYHYNQELPESALDMFIKYPHRMFTDEGISYDTQIKFGICYDVIDNRIIIPIRSEYGSLVTAKGRLATADIKPHMAKYLAYYSYNADSILYGLWENRENIKRKKEVILVESEKSVLKGDSIGVDNIVALSKKKVSENQRKLILSLQCDIVIALDKDVCYDEIKEIAEQFCDLTDVYIIMDTDNLLSEKDAPLDCGEMIWDELYDGRFKYIRE